MSEFGLPTDIDRSPTDPLWTKGDQHLICDGGILFRRAGQRFADEVNHWLMNGWRVQFHEHLNPGERKGLQVRATYSVLLTKV